MCRFGQKKRPFVRRAFFIRLSPFRASAEFGGPFARRIYDGELRGRAQKFRPEHICSATGALRMQIRSAVIEIVDLRICNGACTPVRSISGGGEGGRDVSPVWGRTRSRFQYRYRHETVRVSAQEVAPVDIPPRA